MVFTAAALAIIAIVALILVRAIAGPTVCDRILAVNAFGTLAVLLIAVHGFVTDRPECLDLALVYVLIDFIATIAVTKFVKFTHLGGPLDGRTRTDV